MKVKLEADDAADIKEEATVVEDCPPPSKKCALEEIFDDESDSALEITGVCLPPTPIELAQRELAEYRAIRPIGLGSNPLDFWKHNEKRFPLLSQLALRYLCTQASSVASERVFSTAGDTLSNERSKMSHDKVNMAIFLTKNNKM